MHAYRRFVEDQMDERHWTRADLARHSALSKQTISNIVNDKRDKLGSPPDDKTIDGLARAFSMSRDKVLAHVALAMGLPVSIERADVRAVSDADLLSEVRRRMEARHASQAEDQAGSHPDVQSTRDRTPIDLAQARRVKDDPAAFGDQNRRGELDQGQLQPPPPAERSAAYEPHDGSEGIRSAEESRDRGEENQDDDGRE